MFFYHHFGSRPKVCEVASFRVVEAGFPIAASRVACARHDPGEVEGVRRVLYLLDPLLYTILRKGYLGAERHGERGVGLSS